MLTNMNIEQLTNIEKVDVIYEITYQTNYARFERLDIDETLKDYELTRLLFTTILKAKTQTRTNGKQLFDYLIKNCISKVNKALLERTAILYKNRQL